MSSPNTSIDGPKSDNVADNILVPDGNKTPTPKVEALNPSPISFVPPGFSFPPDDPCVNIATNDEGSIISANSFNSILRNTQDFGGFGGENGRLMSTPYRNRGVEDFGIASAPEIDDERTLQPSSFYSETELTLNDIDGDHNNRSWEFFRDASSTTAYTGPRQRNYGDDLGQRFFGSPRHDGEPPNMPSRASDADFSFLDLNDSTNRIDPNDSMNFLEISRMSNNSFGDRNYNGDNSWDSPSRSSYQQINNNYNNGHNQQQPLMQSPPSPSRLSSDQCFQLIQILSNMLGESKKSGDDQRCAQIIILMQTVQTQLLSDLSPQTPTIITSPITSGNSLSPLDSPESVATFKELAGTSDAPYTWSGTLPPRIHRSPIYSVKIFLGGVPFDITEAALINAFKPFGNIKIEWPGKEIIPSQPKGYLYVIFEHEKQVKLLLGSCFLDYSKSIYGDWYFKLSSKRFREKDVQVIPWELSDSTYMKYPTVKIDGKRTIFVGALHGMMNAEGLAKVMNDLFGGVIYAAVDTDRHKYPIGSGRVAFNNSKSYMKAVSAAFVEIKTKFKKKVQLDPYLEDSMTCSVCRLQQGPYFCREWCCFQYFCRTCYQNQHNTEAFRSHRPLMRNPSKPVGTPGSVTSVTFSPLGNRYNNNNRNVRYGTMMNEYPSTRSFSHI